jgi:hypothetical protein
VVKYSRVASRGQGHGRRDMQNAHASTQTDWDGKREPDAWGLAPFDRRAGGHLLLLRCMPRQVAQRSARAIGAEGAPVDT